MSSWIVTLNRNVFGSSFSLAHGLPAWRTAFQLGARPSAFRHPLFPAPRSICFGLNKAMIAGYS
jgi:hypothetical protein